jgi:hypothetical protein
MKTLSCTAHPAADHFPARFAMPLTNPKPSSPCPESIGVGRFLWWGLWMLLLFPLAGFAQSQAPVVWGEARWMGIGCSWNWGALLEVMGDTLTAVDYFIDTTQAGQPYYVTSNSSHDNGTTWETWQRLDSNYFDGIWISNVASAGHSYILLSEGVPIYQNWLFHSSNAGVQWVHQSIGAYAAIHSALAEANQVVYLRAFTSQDNREMYEIMRSSDYGSQWTAAGGFLRDSTFVGDFGLAMTQSHLLLCGYRYTFDSWHDRAVYARADRTGSNCSVFMEFPGQPDRSEMQSLCVAGDTSSETAIFLSTYYVNGSNQIDAFIHRTTDGGETWSDRIPFTSNSPLYDGAYPTLFCRGKLWGVAWREEVGPYNPAWGLYWRFSANHGKTWYPAQFVDPTFRYVYMTVGQFVGNQVRLYWQGSVDAQDTRADYRTITGLIAPDTLPPSIISFYLSPDSIHAEDTLHFNVTIVENDTLAVASVVILDTSGTGTTLDLVKMDSTHYQATFQVPFVGLFQYHFEAEDFWENHVIAPESGSFNFRASPAVSVTDPRTVTPLSFSVSVAPNPFNSSARISFTLPKARSVDLNVYDVTGRLVRGLAGGHMGPPLQSGEHSFVFDGSDLPSGIYFVRMEAGEFSQTKKMVLLK